MKLIDPKTYPRSTHFAHFNAMAYPYVGICANVDVTNLVAAAKAQGGSPFLACLYAAATAANAVPEMRQRIVGDMIKELDHCDTGHTVALSDGTFTNCLTDCRRSFSEFLVYGREAQEAAKKKTGFVQPGTDETDLIFVSCTPWISFTQVLQPTPIPADSNPRIVFGKFFCEGDKLKMPLAIQCNHALVDGWHLGLFYQGFERINREVETG